jgi:amidohydrolase
MIRHARAAARAALSAAAAFVALAGPLAAQTNPLHGQLDELAAAINDQVVEWRRDIHANPELGMQEFRTAALVAEHLRSLGIPVTTEVGGTGVLGILEGGRPGPVVALRADMDGLPVTELADVPFASKVTTQWQGREVGVMHACGHDNHVAILMGVASVLAEMREDLPGTVKFFFQPAEEGPGGAEPMIAAGVMENPKVDAVFGLHVFPDPVGTIQTRPGGMLASADGLRIVVRGVQTHGAYPWDGVDPIVTASSIVVGLQQIVSRQIDTSGSTAIVTIGQIEGGNRGNIIPDTVLMVGTIRTLDPDTRTEVHRRVRRIAENIAEANGAEAEVTIDLGYPVTVNDAALTARMLPSLRRVVGDDLGVMTATLGAEDFSYFAEEAPGLFIGLGVGADDPSLVHPNHSPYFYADERALPIGVRALASLAVDYLSGAPISQE